MGWIQSLQSPKENFTRVLGAALACWNLPQLARAQGVATSATAAWSSQIIAFWGAVGIGVRSSSWHQASNALTSSIAVVTALRHSNATVASQSLRVVCFGAGLSWRTYQTGCVADMLEYKEWTKKFGDKGRNHSRGLWKISLAALGSRP